MMVMCANACRRDFSAYALRHPGKLGWLLGPSGWKTPQAHIPYALDNDAFSAWKNGTAWDFDPWMKMLRKADAAAIKPLWVLIPDVVANREATLQRWKEYAPEAARFGWPLAFAVQDGMTPADVPLAADVVFVGGTTSWKWRTLPMWCEHFPRVHIGRVNTKRRLEIAERNGAESCDGTGFFRKQWEGEPARSLRNFVEGYRDQTPIML